MITGLSKTALLLESAALLDIHDRSTIIAVNKLLKKREIVQPGAYQKRHGFFYGVYKGKALISVMCIIIAKLNYTPGMITIIVELLASDDDFIESAHCAFSMVEEIKRIVKNQRCPSYVVAQASTKDNAIGFWKGRLTYSSWANIYIGLLYLYDANYIIYEDVNNMIF